MSRVLALFGVVFVTLCLAHGSSHAQTAAWRCDGSTCTDSQLNSLEDHMMAHWPSTVTLSPSNFPFSCDVILDSCPHCLTGDPPAARPAVSITWPGSVAWSASLVSGLSPFLIGRFSASAAITGQVHVTADGSTWPGSSIDYIFQDACDANGNCSDVIAPEGDTGIVGLGNLLLTTTAGSFWTSTIRFHVNVGSVAQVLSCNVGYPGHVHRLTSPGTSFDVNYPVAETPLADLLSQNVRAQFTQAARAVALGLP
jgi:hypothetical protein